MGELHLYDFDGTLFRSPESPLGDVRGWWSKEQSLNPPCVPDNPDASWWNLPVVVEAKQSISNPDVLAVLLTGRRDAIFRWRVPELLKGIGLRFDQVALGQGASVAAFKAQVVSQLLSRYPVIGRVVFWDDTAENLAAVGRVVEQRGRVFVPVKVRTVTAPALCNVEDLLPIRQFKKDLRGEPNE
jgi:hypothetical protein